MPTQKHRFSITLDEETFKIYKRFSELAGKPTCTIISSMLVEARDHFVQLGVLLQKAKTLQGDTLEQKAAFVARIDMGLHRAQATVDLMRSDLVQMAEEPQRQVSVAPATPRSGRGEKAPQSLIHRNYSPKSMPTRVPEVSTPKKRKVKK